MARCLMCGSDGELSREHAIPAWIGRELNTTSEPVGHRYEGFPGSGISREWTAKCIDIKVKKICKTCNNGWMSRLEKEAEPVLTPLIQGTSRAVTTVECKLITRWFLKTMLMLELAGDRTQRVALPTHEDWVRAGHLPPDVALWLGAARRPSGTATGGRLVNVRLGEREGPGWLFALVVGHLVLVAFGAPEGLGQSALTAPLSGALTRLWPSPPLVAAFPPSVRLGRKQVPLIVDLVHQSLPSRLP
ncbi:hypothetical protein [Lentzea flaviverrucosa]|uniref:HNH endonuclease n=1 Tax=Lentzea flaviverrucosa TaxID=200379 RepID=A0A1H9XAT8_9PSEU|nr:hypothetical protein [Lentzea flaviverrucosa]RDI21705.1 hypothetical protein DFR72_113252 [Lentzea flaviverrucosa]SES43007.1 hypothetical protein SAMN05216195_11428 [Lentzea flaviverrucosa]